MSNRITLVPADHVRPSTYNPRHADPKRLDLIELSLRKLGFLLPLYAGPDGEISSGHQRHLVATERLGCTHVPVVRLPKLDLQTRKAINVTFNRGTNDLGRADTPDNLTAALQEADPWTLAKDLPDLSPHTDAFFPCLHAEPRLVGELTTINRGNWNRYARNLAANLYKRGIEMPVVCAPDGVVVNGIGRLQVAAEKKRRTIDVVHIPHTHVRFADAMLNLLSMDFDIETRYADYLRHNSFRRERRSRKYLGRGFVFALIGSKPGYTFDITREDHARQFRRQHGRRILDFGAGHLQETELLRQAGFDVTPFEPYHLVEGEIDKAASLEMTRLFLEQVAQGKRWSSIFISSVLNSVPFLEDRRHIATILAALSTSQTAVYACASATDNQTWENLNGADRIHPVAAKSNQFKLTYEPGITLGDLSTAPKVQKFHTKEEFYRLFVDRFSEVAISHQSNNVQAICRRPFAPDPDALAAAIDFEFDLPYPDGSRMGLAREAREAFAQRLRLPQLTGTTSC